MTKQLRGRGRPPKNPEHRREQRLQIKLTLEEIEYIRKVAHHANKSLTQTILDGMMAIAPDIPRPTDRDMIAKAERWTKQFVDSPEVIQQVMLQQLQISQTADTRRANNQL